MKKRKGLSMRYQITSDSTCDLSPEQLEQYNIRLLPLYVSMDGKTLRDGVDVKPNDIYAHVSAGGDVGIDIVGLDVHAVAQRLAVHAHIEGQQADIILFQLLRAEITGRVRRDLISHRESLPFFHLHPCRMRVLGAAFGKSRAAPVNIPLPVCRR